MSAGFKDTLIGALRSDHDFNFAVAEGTPALVGIAVFIDIDAAVHVAALKQDADKFFIFLRFHASPMTGTTISK